MKTIKLVLHQPSINKLIGSELSLSMSDDANVINAIVEVDKVIKSVSDFPVQDYGSLLHMVYNPAESRFYKQVAVTAYDKSGNMLNVRDDPKKNLPEETTVILVPAGGCISEWEEAVSHQEFSKTT